MLKSLPLRSPTPRPISHGGFVLTVCHDGCIKLMKLRTLACDAFRGLYSLNDAGDINAET